MPTSQQCCRCSSSRALCPPTVPAQKVNFIPFRLQVVRNIIAKDGLVNGLLIRGLGTKILANGLQGMMFTVLWRLGQDWWAKKEQA